jgi:poly(hydroxyalkanoate) granule-associated protein
METSTQTGSERNVQEEIKDSVHRIWLAGLGALAAAEEEGGKIFSRLVERGRDVESKGKVEVD